MKQAVLGLGGVGGLVAAALSRAGHDVVALVRPAAAATYPPSLSLSAPEGSFTAAVRPRAALDEPVDVLWIAVKATQLDAALAQLGDAREAGTIVPLLNGIDHLAALRARFGEERVVAATIGVEAERVAEGRFVRHSSFAIVGVTVDGEQRLHEPLAALGQSAITTRTFAGEPALMWTKLAFLAPLALATSAAGASIGEVAADPTLRAELEACMGEACAVAVADGAAVSLEKTIARVAQLAPTQRSSMERDLAAGLPPELDAIAGPILRRAARYGIGAAGDRSARREGAHARSQDPTVARRRDRRAADQCSRRRKPMSWAASKRRRVRDEKTTKAWPSRATSKLPRRHSRRDQ